MSGINTSSAWLSRILNRYPVKEKDRFIENLEKTPYLTMLKHLVKYPADNTQVLIYFENIEKEIPQAESEAIDQVSINDNNPTAKAFKLGLQIRCIGGYVELYIVLERDFEKNQDKLLDDLRKLYDRNLGRQNCQVCMIVWMACIFLSFMKEKSNIFK